MSEETAADVPTVTVVAKDSNGVPFDTVKILGDREAVLAVTAAVARVGVLEGALREILHFPFDVGHTPERDLQAMRQIAGAVLAGGEAAGQGEEET